MCLENFKINNLEDLFLLQEHLSVLVYVITAMHMDKAQKYTDKAVRGAEPYRKLQTSAGSFSNFIVQ